MLNFSITSTHKDTLISLAISGEIDIHTVPKLNESLESAISSNPKGIIADLQKVTYIDSTGLGSFARSSEKLAQQDGKFYITSVPNQILKLFQMSGLTPKHVVFIESESEVTQ